MNQFQQDKILEFTKKYPLQENLIDRIPNPHFKYIGKEVWEDCIAAILAGKNLLLVGDKSTGKNVLAENLAFAFKRPLWNVSFHVNIDSSVLIGTDTLENGDVKFRPGPIYMASNYGGFAVLDEINMAKNEAMAILHSILDYRKIIDVPGYDFIKLNPATRFIATMNYAYQGTRDLNEALLSRFVVIQIPVIKYEDLLKLIQTDYPNMKEEIIEQIAKFFFDLKRKSDAGEISDTSPDLRGIFDAIDLVKEGISLNQALNLTISNKLFDQFERDLIKDLVKARFKNQVIYKDVFK